MNYEHSEIAITKSLFKTGARVSIIQSVLFLIIAFSALGLGIDRFISDGFESMYRANSWLFLLLCGAFILIATLGVAITPAEKKLINKYDSGLAAWGSNLAFFGHMGTIAFFTWWIFFVSLNQDTQTSQVSANMIMPIRWGVMFELFFVGLWVWIIAYIVFKHGILSKGFLVISVLKAISFWLAFAAFIVNSKLFLLLGVGLVAVVFGPLWHAWIAVIFLRYDYDNM